MKNYHQLARVMRTVGVIVAIAALILVFVGDGIAAHIDYGGSMGDATPGWMAGSALVLARMVATPAVAAIFWVGGVILGAIADRDHTN